MKREAAGNQREEDEGSEKIKAESESGVSD